MSNKFLIKIIIALALLFLAVASIYFLYQEKPFLEEEVHLDIFGPQNIVAGSEIEYRVTYKNNSQLLLKDAELIFDFPLGAMLFSEESHRFERANQKIIKLGNLESQKEGSEQFKATIFGFESEVKTAKIKLSYMPEEINAHFSAEKSLDTTINSVPLALKFNFPSDITLGKEVEFSLNYISTSKTKFSDLRIKIDYPKGFEFLSSLPKASYQNNIWDIGSLEEADSREIRVKGRFIEAEGETDLSRIFKAELGMFSEASGEFILYKTAESRISVSPLPFSLTQVVKNAKNLLVDSGQSLVWEISYKNDSDEILENPSIFCFLEGEAFDYSSLELEKGTFNSANKSISWKSDSIEELAYLEPGENGKLTFSIKIKENLPIDSFEDKNFAVKSRIMAKLSNLTLKEGEVTLKVNSDLTFIQRGVFKESPIENSGPIPPKVGEKTTFTILWQLLNSSNDVNDLKIRGALPGYVKWEGKVYPKESNISFNADTGEIVWNVGKLPAATGILMPVKQVAFQVSISPVASQVGKVLELIGPSSAMGDDTFTAKLLESLSGAVDTTLPDDPGITHNDGVVIP